MKCTDWPSIVVTNCGRALSLASWSRQSNSVRQCLDQFADVVERNPVAPRHAGQVIGPAHLGKARLEVVEPGLRQLSAKRS